MSLPDPPFLPPEPLASSPEPPEPDEIPAAPQDPSPPPPALLAMIREAAGDRAEAVLAGLAEVRQPAFRANTLRGKVGELRAELDRAGMPYAPHAISDWSFTTTIAGEQLLRTTQAYAEGRVYSQGIAAQLPALLGNVRPGMRVLDACAAPGGKTGLLAMRLGDGGRGLTACERAAVRFQKLEHTMRLLGAERVRTLCCDSREPPPGVAKAHWDHILVDAPCSGSGMVELAKPWSWKLLREDHDAYVASRARIQRTLVERAAAMLRHGGTLVYSTCSLDPRENEAIASHILGLRTRLKPVDLSGWAKRFPGTAGPGLTAFRGESYAAEAAAGWLRLWPCAVHEGFFVAMFKAA